MFILRRITLDVEWWLCIKTQVSPNYADVRCQACELEVKDQHRINSKQGSSLSSQNTYFQSKSKQYFSPSLPEIHKWNMRSCSVAMQPIACFGCVLFQPNILCMKTFLIIHLCIQMVLFNYVEKPNNCVYISVSENYQKYGTLSLYNRQK